MAAYTQIAKQMELPDFLISKVAAESVKTYEAAPWEIKELDLGKFISHFASKYQYTFYKDFDYEATGYCLKKTVKNGDWNFSFRYIALFIKVLLLNRRILNFLRKK